jgi:hypothetical protein
VTRSRVVAIAERRSSLARLLIALFVLRVEVTVTEIIESKLTVFAAVITAAIGIEAWRAWRVSRAAHATGTTAPPLPDTIWNRILLPLERRGPVVLYALTAIYAVAFIALAVAGEPRDTLVDVALISREAITFFFLAVVIAGYLSVRGVSQEAPGT